METLVTVLLVIGTLTAIALIAWSRHGTARARVLGELGRIHATQVALSPDWFDLDRDTMTYDVEYSTPDGKRHSNRCKVAVHIGSDQGVYWERSLKGARSLVLVIALAAAACGVPKQYTEDRDHLNTAIAAFGQASAEVVQAGAGSSGPTMMTPALRDSLIAIIGRGLASADSVGDPFLAWLHPQLPRQFRDNLVAGERLLLEGIRAEDSGRVARSEQLLVQWEQFWHLHRAELATKANP